MQQRQKKRESDRNKRTFINIRGLEILKEMGLTKPITKSKRRIALVKARRMARHELRARKLKRLKS